MFSRVAETFSAAAALAAVFFVVRPASAAPSVDEELNALRAQLAHQQSEIDQLQAALASQRAALERLATAAPAPPVSNLKDLPKEHEREPAASNGFQFSGDFRYRYDLQLRSANPIAGAVQNSRARYRVRLNIDKALDRHTDPRLRFHLQLSTGPYNVETTNDQDFAGFAVKHPFSIAEAFMEYRPLRSVVLRGGRMEEVFADGTRFLWDDDVRFNGFEQRVNVGIPSRPFGFHTFELRGGEYILSNPNLAAVPASSPLVTTGVAPGRQVRDAAFFHPGAILRGDLGGRWAHRIQADASLYRNANQIQLASTLDGYQFLAGNPVGLQLSGPVGPPGSATTEPGGVHYYAPRYQIAHLAYRLERKGIHWRDRELPFWVDLQGSRNVGTSTLRDAVMASANLGDVRGRGDIRFLYQFAIKDANSLVSQFTDDDLGTQVTTNIAVHAVRFDLGITRYLQWQNLLFLQNARRASAPGEYVAVPRGANATVRFLGQLAFTF